MKRIVFLPIAFTLLVVGCAPRFAELPPLIPRQAFFDNPAKKDPQISPDGKYLAYLAPDNRNVLQIWVRSLDGQDDRQLTAEERRGIHHYTWTYDQRHLVFAHETDGDENWQINVVDAFSGSVRNLTPYHGVRSLLVGMEPSQSSALLVAMNLRNRRYFDVYRINIDSGETRMVNRNGGRQFWWIADHRLNVRVAAAFAGTIVRDVPRQPWRAVRKWQTAENAKYFGYSADGTTLFMSGANDDGGALFSLDLASGQETVLASDPNYDVEDVFIHPKTRNIQAVAFYRDKLEWQVLDQSVADDFTVLGKIQNGEFSVVHPPYESPILYSRNLGRRDLKDQIWIVSYETDQGPIHYYLYDRTAKTARFLFSEHPKLDSVTLARMQPISYRSRDDLQIHGYLTLPAGAPQRNLPIVLYVHGGPWLRDRWGYYNVIQWLANRGYGVLQVNYRGSTGYGRKFMQASYKEWGGKMHDDLIDGVNWLIAKGIADPARIAIMGGSYGGYAALVGLTLTPEVFAVGVSSVGISNLISHYNNYPPYWSLSKPRFRARVGDPQKDEELLKARSPLFHVDQIKAPLLIAHGTNDARVVASESEQMVAAMRQANKPVDYVIYRDEGHRQWLPETKFDFYAKVEEFLAKHLGGRLEPANDAPGAAAVAK